WYPLVVAMLRLEARAVEVVCGIRHPVAERPKHLGEHAANPLLVVDDEDRGAASRERDRVRLGRCQPAAEREADREGRALVRRRVDADRPLVALDDAVAHREAEPGPLR